MNDRPQFRLHASVVVRDGPRILLVQEAKAACRGKWNLPGGHIDHREEIPIAAARELREETGLELSLMGLIGIYRGDQSFRFVFLAEIGQSQPVAGDEILAIRWATVQEAEMFPDQELLSPKMFRKIMADVRCNTMHSISFD
jgi:8-oxo-dGTP pyrophosphatase MutT (NUDIX family)